MLKLLSKNYAKDNFLGIIEVSCELRFRNSLAQ